MDAPQGAWQSDAQVNTRVPTTIALLLAAWLLPSALSAAPSATAHAYLEHALDLMQQNSLHRATLDFRAIRAHAFAAAADAETTQDTWPAIRIALAALGDGHSALLTPGDAPLPERHDAGADVPSPALPSGRILDGRIGYLHVPGHRRGGRDADVEFADALQTLIYRIERTSPCGWVVDLRDNPGGNMWPMLAGLEPLLGGRDVGAFRDAEGGLVRWWVDAGAAGAGDTAHAASHYAVEVGAPRARVAVLTGPVTASSGEAVAVAFRGRSGARSFGSPTRGVSTGNRGFVLDDGAVLFITASRFVDRTGMVHGGPLEPDVAVEPSAALDPAVAWLQQHARCRTMPR